VTLAGRRTEGYGEVHRFRRLRATPLSRRWRDVLWMPLPP